MREVFVSYASGDQIMADRLVAALEKRGLRCWIASRELPAGANYQSEIPSAIAACTIFVLLHSRQAAANPHEIEKEMSIARRARKPFIPVRLDDSQPDKAFLFELATTQYLDLFPDFDAAVHRLSMQLAALCDNQSEVERRAGRMARMRTVRMWSFRTALVVIACVGAVLAWKAAPVLQAMTHRSAASFVDRSETAPDATQVVQSTSSWETTSAKHARAFAGHYYAVIGAPAATWLQFLDGALTDPVRYFGRQMPKASLITIQRAFAARWPVRYFRVRADSLAITCAHDAKSCLVAGIEDYTLRADARGAGVSGVERFSMQLTGLAGTTTQLTAISTTSMERHKLDQQGAVSP